MEKLYEKTLNSKVVYDGLIVKIELDEVELSNGRKTKREVARHAPGVVILAELNDKIFLVKQFRYPSKEIIYELPAGKLDKNEDILEGAKRELLEETGYEAAKWTYLGYIDPSPGFLDEKLHLFYADKLRYIGQKLDEDEFLNFEQIDKKVVFKMIKEGKINDAKSICAITRKYFI